MSSGDVHPAAIASTISLPSIPGLSNSTDYDIVIDRDRLDILILISEAPRELVIWNWKTGMIIMVNLCTWYAWRPISNDLPSSGCMEERSSRLQSS